MLATRLALAVALASTLAASASAREGPATQATSARAVFAGGCFWCMEAPFDKLPGVLSSTSGFAGGQTKNPTYEQVSSGSTGHAEAVQVLYDPKRITYAQLLETFWHNIDPLDKGGQFCDRGNQYRSAVFYGNDEERKEAEASRARVEQRLGRPVATQIVAAGAFYPAEEYHQDFYRKNPARYNQYRTGCGRDRRLKELWGADAGGHGGSR
ncbi:MAG TPA: peptide-methionine (S)-S-oxide reductase MsrA [Vicinamibacteria bacterium]|jgi:peptide-methionine (S)-S-oxide reductase